MPWYQHQPLLQQLENRDKRFPLHLLSFFIMNSTTKAFKELVALRYQIYNSLFLTLNLDGVHQTGIQLPLLSDRCQQGFAAQQTPDEIITGFFAEFQTLTDEQAQVDQLFRFIQYIERQIVLVDALEDAAFTQVNDVNGSGSYGALFQRAANSNATDKLKQALHTFKTRIVLTAHPTQFYPGAVLGITSDLDIAIRNNNLAEIEQYLEQLGKTPFFKKEKPTPLDEAISLIWYLENIFYHSIPAIFEEIYASLGSQAEEILAENPLLQLGFWPGGDRDGNPFVTTETTLLVANKLRQSLMRSYYRDLRTIKRRITFRGTEKIVTELHDALYAAAFAPETKAEMTLDWLKSKLGELEAVLNTQHNGLFLNLVKNFSHKVHIFGFHFSTLDIRQDSRIITKAFNALLEQHPDLVPANFHQLNEKQQIDILFQLKGKVTSAGIEDLVSKDTIDSFYTIKTIQQQNGEYGANRYIISNCRNELDIAHVFALAGLTGWGENLSFDIVPLFETIDDLKTGHEVMQRLYTHPIYGKHLENRMGKQAVMLGFSDGTKDGGYLTANWEIYRAKENITLISRQNEINVVFFDGRGGPPARGGGNTHKFYASLGNAIESNQIQLTVQGQTISSNFGTIDSSRYNLEQLLSAGLENTVISADDKQLDDTSRALINELSAISYTAYQQFKSHRSFIPFLEKMTTLKYYGETNIGSRPAKRGKSAELKFEDLRAIPFVGAWSQLKQNVPGFYGLGTTFEAIDKAGRLEEVKILYSKSLFFRTLLENSMQSLSKSYFPLTVYMKSDPEFGPFWELIYHESELAKVYLLEISGQSVLLENNPTSRESIKLREQIVLPLLTIQQHALIRIKQLEKTQLPNEKLIGSYRKLVVRSLYGNTNAARNSA